MESKNEILVEKLVDKLITKYVDLEINFINEHFKMLNDRYIEIINKFNTAVSEISKKPQVYVQDLNTCLSLFYDFKKAGTEYTQKVTFKVKPVPIDPLGRVEGGRPEGITGHINTLQFICDKPGFYSATKEDILKALNGISSSFSPIQTYMTKATQTQRKEVLGQAIGYIKPLLQGDDLQSNLEKSNASSPTMFKK